jgi:hypothetical protein
MGLLEGKCLETITVKRKTSHGLAGDPVRGTTLTMAARVERGLVRVTSPEGTELTFAAKVFTEQALVESDLLFFSEDDTSSNEAGRAVRQLDTIRDMDGQVDHWEAYL